VAIDAGRTISPTVAGVLASFGRTRVPVFRRLRVGVIVTGDEVVDAAATPSPYEVRDSHAPALRAMLGAVPWIDLAPPIHVRDDEAALDHAARDTLAHADALIITAGVSVGPCDLVPDALSRLGAETLFRGVRQRPGRPTMGAITPDARPIFALPGNPLSVFVAARAIVAPVLAHMAGLNPNALAPALVELSYPDHRAAPHHWHRLVTLEAHGQARLVPMQSSGDIPAAARASGFVTIPPETNTNARTHHPYHPWNL
jgi:molybdopterin molybdotransferase